MLIPHLSAFPFQWRFVVALFTGEIIWEWWYKRRSEEGDGSLACDAGGSTMASSSKED